MRKYRSPFISVVFWTVMLIFCAIIAYDLVSMPKNQNDVICRSDMQWFSNNDSPININDSAQISGIIHDNTYSVYFIQDKYEENTSIAFKTNFSEVQVLLNDTVIYSTKNGHDISTDGMFSLRAPASEIHIAGIKKINEGDKLSLKVTNFYDDTICGVSNVFFGHSEDIIDTIFKNDILGIILCIAVFAVCILMFIFHFAFRKAVSLHGIKYAACFAFFAALHSLSEWSTLSFLLIFGNNFLYVVHNLSFLFMFLPLIMFFTENVQFRTSVSCLQISAMLQIMVILGLSVLAAANIVDLHQILPISEWVGLVQCLFIFFVLFYDFSKKTEKRSLDFIRPVIYTVFLICAAIGHILCRGNSISVLFTFSSLLFLSAVLVINMREVAYTLSLSNEVEEIGKAAFTDALTGVGNTAAYNKKIKHLEVVKVNYKSIAIIQFDINNLKTINDNLGHEQGDKLITDGAAIIYKVFGKIGDVYRTGGDEFVGIIYGDKAMVSCHDALIMFERAIDEYNSDDSHSFILQIAYGADYYCSEDERRYLTLKEVQKQADANMYDKKREMKTHVTKEQILKKEPLSFNIE